MFGITPQTALQTVAVVLMVIGLMGAVLPALPGAILIFVGALIWAWADGFARVGWPVLLLLGLLALVSMGTDWVLTTIAMRKAGATWKTVAAAIIGGLAGGSLGSAALPIIGTLFGAAAGAAGGVIALEYYQRRDWPPALKTARNYCLGSALSAVINTIICLAMLGIFVLASRN
jgi:hypothetical protein